MIERVNWHDRRAFDKTDPLDQVQGKITSPFDQDSYSRPLRITYHFDTLKDLSQDEHDALEVLKEFSNPPLVEALRIGDGEYLSIKFGKAVDDELFNGLQEIEVDYGDHRVESAVLTTNWLKDYAKELAMTLGAATQDKIYDDFVAAHASLAMGHDVFVTTSRWLIENRSHHLIEKTNPRSPLETLKILGLLMRSRGDYRYAHWGQCNRTLYYQIFIFSKIPALWRYVNAFLIGQIKPAYYGIAELAETIISRSMRSVQAHDEIGKVFYRQHTIDTEENMMYHFDYLGLLLSGILDSQALIVYRLLGLKDPPEYLINFRKNSFVQKISEHNKDLASYINDKNTKTVINLIAEIRNTIHREKLPLVNMNNQIKEYRGSLIYIPETHYESPNMQSAWEICKSIDAKQEWGIIDDASNVWIEPFTFTTSLLDRSLHIIGTIIRKTDLSSPSDDLKNAALEKVSPGNETLFDSEMKARRFILLG